MALRPHKCVLLWCMLISLAAPLLSANADEEKKTTLSSELGDVFHRTMEKWQMSYTVQQSRKAGVACIPWSKIGRDFLASGIFEAIGFSYSMATDEAAIRVATQGCHEMANHYKVEGCMCEVVFLNDDPAAVTPEGFSLSQNKEQ